MKSYHVVLLVAGAGLAAGLAYQMTQVPPIPAPARSVASAPSTPSPSPSTPELPVRKPGPMPQKARVTPPVTAHASAPETVYTEPPKPVAHKSQPVAPPKPARKNEPVSVARIKLPSIKPPSIKPPSIRPKQWIPGKYESAGDSSAAAKTPAPQVLAKPAPAPVVPASIQKSAAATVVPAVEKNTKPAAQVAPHQATLQSGMTITIRLDEPLSIDFSRAGTTFAGELVDPVIADGFVIAERGSPVAGRVLESLRAGRFTGTSRLQLGLTSVSTSDGQQVEISTQPWMRLGGNIPTEMVIRFRLTSSVTITERQLASK